MELVYIYIIMLQELSSINKSLMNSTIYLSKLRTILLEMSYGCSHILVVKLRFSR